MKSANRDISIHPDINLSILLIRKTTVVNRIATANSLPILVSITHNMHDNNAQSNCISSQSNFTPVIHLQMRIGVDNIALSSGNFVPEIEV